MPYLNFKSTKVYYTDSGDSTKPTIVFIHGLVSSSKIYKRQISHFSKTHRVVAYDLLGHGYSYSPAPNEVDYSIASQIDILAALFDHLQISHATLVAWSLGGFIAVEFTHRYPRKVDSLVLIGTAAMFIAPNDEPVPDYPTALPRSAYEAWISGWADSPRIYSIAFALSQYPESTPTDYPEYVAESMQDALSVSAEVAKASMALMDQRPYYREIQVPVFVVHGANDANVKVDSSRWTYENVAGANTLKIYENVGHVPFVVNAEEFNKDMATFLNVNA
jgi:pimeloyl-ACP methyl ester carboxylesterase